jgi:hypothetical protein
MPRWDNAPQAHSRTFDLTPKWQRTLPFFGNCSWDMYRVTPKSKYQRWYLTPCCGLEVQKPTQAPKSVKGSGNIYKITPKVNHPLPVLWRHFPWRHFRHVTSGSLLPVMSNGTFCITTLVRKKCGNAFPGIRKTYFRLWRHFRSRDFMCRHFRSGPLPFAPSEICHELSRYTTKMYHCSWPEVGYRMWRDESDVKGSDVIIPEVGDSPWVWSYLFEVLWSDIYHSTIRSHPAWESSCVWYCKWMYPLHDMIEIVSSGNQNKNGLFVFKI